MSKVIPDRPRPADDEVRSLPISRQHEVPTVPRASTKQATKDMLALTSRRPHRTVKRTSRRSVAEYREFQDQQEIEGTRYRVVRLIGAGGMGTVYEVEHIALGKRFVLKALLRELARREDLVQRLRNEWRALGRLEHPNIVTVTDAGTTASGVPFFVMERLEGETLAQRMRRVRRFEVAEAVHIAAAILEGLDAAHEIGIVHRDVKPPNIILVAGDKPKILDFGVAKISDDPGVVTARGVAIGTPRYMSPEQARGEPVDGRADLYSCGLLLFEMVTGVGPFDDARDSNELILAHLARIAPPLSTLAMGVPPELDRVAASLLHKNRHRRPPTAREAVKLLRQAIAAAPEAPTSRAVLEKADTLYAPRAVAGRPARVDDTTRPSQRSAPRSAGTSTSVSPPPFSAAQSLPFRMTVAEVKTAADAGIDPCPSPSGASPSLRAVVTSLGDTMADAPAEPFSAPPSRPLELAAPQTEVLTTVPEAEAKETRTLLPRRQAPSSVTPPPIAPQTDTASVRSRRPAAIALASVAALLLAGVVGSTALQRRRADAAAASSPALKPTRPLEVHVPPKAPAAEAEHDLRVPAASPVLDTPTEAPRPAAAPALPKVRERRLKKSAVPGASSADAARLQSGSLGSSAGGPSARPQPARAPSGTGAASRSKPATRALPKSGL